MLRGIVSRLPFPIAVALVAAAVGDPLVETVANSGLFGRGFSDNNHLSVIPALVAGILLVLLLACWRGVQLYRHTRQREALLELAKHISARAPLRDLPYVLIFQFGALFVMESTEQLAFGGKLLGGTVWLGGPVLFSVLAHALIGTICTLALARAIRAMVRHVATFVRITLDFILVAIARKNSGRFAPLRRESSSPRFQTLHVCQIGERAPPALLTLTY